MDRKARKFQPQASELESKLLLSVAPTSTPPADGEMAVLMVRSGSAPASPVVSVVEGRYHAAEDNRAADAPYRVQFQGSGKVDALGKAKVVGQLDLGGFRVAGLPQVTGTVTLSNARGSVKLALTGGDGFGEVPNGRFATTATVVKATGAYRGFQRDAAVTVDFGPDQVPSSRSAAGAATVTLSLKPMVK